MRLAAVAALIIGGLVGAVLLLVLRPDLSAWRAVPGWAWVAGAAGFVVVLGISYAVPRLGITPTLSIVTAILGPRPQRHFNGDAWNCLHTARDCVR